MLLRDKVIYLRLSTVFRELLLNRHPAASVCNLLEGSLCFNIESQRMGSVHLLNFLLLIGSSFCGVYQGNLYEQPPLQGCIGIYQAVVSTALLIVISDPGNLDQPCLRSPCVCSSDPQPCVKTC